MKNRYLIFIITVISAFVFISESRADSPTDSLNVAPFGKVFIYKQTATPQNVVIMISGEVGWKSGVTGFAETFSKMNTMVIGVDIVRYYKNLKQRQDECYNVGTDFVELTIAIEKKYNFPDYAPPVIMGYSSGATLVYGILAQSRTGSFIGGISLGFCPNIELPKMLCQAYGLSQSINVPGKSYFFQPDTLLENRWIVLQGKIDKVCSYSEVSDFVNKTADAELISLENVGHGFSKVNNFMPQWKDAYINLIKKSEKLQATSVNFDLVKNLPLVITKTNIHRNDAPLALLISGDGGWYGFEQLISDSLARVGIATIGLDSRKYFWKRRSTEETADDLALALNYYAKEWGKRRLLLIGYSLGGEIVPFIVNKWSDEMKSKIVSTVLLSPAITTDLEVHISNMLGLGNRQNTYNVVDEIIKMQPVPTLCIFGEGEKNPVPQLLAGTSAKIRFVPGDHHYRSNVKLLIETMRENQALWIF